MNKLDEMLSMLDQVKPNGKGRWMACCPAHGDLSPSLSIRELSDGRILLNCFGGCGVDEVIGSLGMSMGDLFPEDLSAEYRPLKQKTNDLSRDEWVVKIGTGMIANGKRLNESEKKQVMNAALNIKRNGRK